MSIKSNNNKHVSRKRFANATSKTRRRTNRCKRAKRNFFIRYEFFLSGIFVAILAWVDNSRCLIEYDNNNNSQLSKESRRRKSIIPSNMKNDNAFTSMHIENIEQLKYGIEKNSVQLKNAGLNMRIEYKDIVNKINVEMKNHFITKCQLHDKNTQNLNLKIRILKMKKNMKKIVQSVEQNNIDDNNSFVFHQKNTTSKNFFDSSIIIDVVNSDIKEGLSTMKNKLTDNSDGYSTNFQKIIYVRTRIENMVLTHITVKLKKGAKRLFITIEEIFDVLGLMYDDLNRKVNAMKTFKRFKQIDVFKNFIMFGTEFQRLSIDAKMNNIEILLKNLKNKMSYELQKIMTIDVYESINLYDFAKKCQYINQILRDVENRLRFNRSIIDDEVITTNENAMLAINKTVILVFVTSLFRQITSALTSRFVTTSISFKAMSQQLFESPQINVMKCYNCNKMSHIFRNCFDSSAVFSRGAVIKEIITENTENEKSKKE